MIQFGRFSMPSPDQDWEISRWYAETRMADFAKLPGGIRARRLVNACGSFSRYGVFYEFTSVEDRLKHFGGRLEAVAHDETNPSPAHRTVHEPLSSCVGTLLGGGVGSGSP